MRRVSQTTEVAAMHELVSSESTARRLIAGTMRWVAANVRSFSYLLPDPLEMVLYVSLALYFAIAIMQQQA